MAEHLLLAISRFLAVWRTLVVYLNSESLMIVVKLESSLAMQKEPKLIVCLIQFPSVYESAVMWSLMKDEDGIGLHQQLEQQEQLVVTLWWNFPGRKKSLEQEDQRCLHLLNRALPRLESSQQQSRCLMQK
jgi:hypothetical protein